MVITYIVFFISIAAAFLVLIGIGRMMSMTDYERRLFEGAGPDGKPQQAGEAH